MFHADHCVRTTAPELYNKQTENMYMFLHYAYLELLSEPDTRRIGENVVAHLVEHGIDIRRRFQDPDNTTALSKNGISFYVGVFMYAVATRSSPRRRSIPMIAGLRIPIPSPFPGDNVRNGSRFRRDSHQSNLDSKLQDLFKGIQAAREEFFSGYFSTGDGKGAFNKVREGQLIADVQLAEAPGDNGIQGMPNAIDGQPA